MSEMTLKEVQNEISRLRSIEKQLEKEEREKHREAAQEFIGRCYRRTDGVVLKIVSTPVEVWDMYRTIYNQYQFPAVILQYPDQISNRQYKSNSIDEFTPCYCDTVYLNIDHGIVGSPMDKHSYQEISQEEFAAEFDKCIESFKEQIGINKPKPKPTMSEKEFYDTYCRLCGSQRCPGPGDEFAEGCSHYQKHMANKEM